MELASTHCVMGEPIFWYNPIEWEEVCFDKPTDSLHAGIAIIYQEFNPVPGLGAAENMFLGIEPSDYGWIRISDEKRKAKEILSYRINIDPDRRCDQLTVTEKQLVEIAKLVRDARILIMDEPSAALTDQEVYKLYELVEELKSQGIGIVYVSHHLEEVEAGGPSTGNERW